ncbi:hypothetical protein AAFF_G00326710 [Aldrovandia affinis]|uniref:Schwannomin interacting protein 1 C-terminal domain-containing protein n=1 Tax=Aldrovandia affinis TaxID=143900 RepID=A0AAD7TAI9_9TELE|nr:hypothetical protein AAFF_G00326710 [Aldrovandia affinis]
MEGNKEKEKEKERGEKESDEAEDFCQAMKGATMAWQERYSEDDLDLPIMHWEALNLRIAELEKQEEERRERSKYAGVLEHGSVSGGWIEEREQENLRETWQDGKEDDNSRLTALTSRLQTQMNLQLCFINNSESEDEDDDRESGREISEVVGMGGRGTVKQPPPLTADGGTPARLKLEVRAALNALRNKLRIEHKEKKLPDMGMERKRLNHGGLQTLSLQQLNALRASLNQAIHDLSSKLVGRLLTRDQLRTEQDAMFLEVQDMASL